MKAPGEMSDAETKHEMLLWESRYLQRRRWEPIDIIDSSNEGYTWKDSNGDGPFSQQVAVDTQKERDRDPAKQMYHDLGVTFQNLDKISKEKISKGFDTTADQRQLQVIAMEMVAITNRKRGGSPIPPHR